MARAEKTRNGGTWSEARYMQQIRSHLRNAFRYWKPIQDCKKAARRPNQSANQRLKWESQCAECKQWFPEKETQVDHTLPVGPLKALSDVAGFLERLSAEEGYTNLCKSCHKKVTAREGSLRKEYPNMEPRWQNILQRCYNKNATGYARYGGRGIGVCERWREDFMNFYNDMGEAPEGTSLDRIDNDKDYSKENCRWATQTEQARNTSSNVCLDADGEVLCVSEWGERLGIKPNTITTRLRRGWSVEEALEIKAKDKNYAGRLTKEEIANLVSSIDMGMSQSEWGRQNNMDTSQVSRLYNRFKTNEERSK